MTDRAPDIRDGLFLEYRVEASTGPGQARAAAERLTFRESLDGRLHVHIEAEEATSRSASTGPRVARVMPVWFLLEGAASIAAIGYFLTGAPVCAIVAGALVAAYWLCGPNVFAKA